MAQRNAHETHADRSVDKARTLPPQLSTEWHAARTANADQYYVDMMNGPPAASADWHTATADAAKKEQQRVAGYYADLTRQQDERRHREDVEARAKRTATMRPNGAFGLELSLGDAGHWRES
jgi:hypothetical protein